MPAQSDGSPDIAIRPATEMDNAALIDLEVRTPVAVGETLISFDRSPDYFADARLHEFTRSCVALYGGRVVGVCSGVVFNCVLPERAWQAVLTQHLRVAPEFHQHGIGAALMTWLQRYWVAEHVNPDWQFTYVDVRNQTSLAFSHASSRQPLNIWPIDAWVQELPADEPATGASPANLTADELDDALALVNSTHRGLQLFIPYSRRRLEQRLTRSSSYTLAHWRGIRRGKRLVAVAGVYDRGAHLAVRTARRDGLTETPTRSLAVIDYGFAPGYEGAMVELLDAVRGMAGTCGRQSVQISVPEESPLFSAVTGRAARSRRFNVLGKLPAIAPGDPVRSFFTDPLYL